MRHPETTRGAARNSRAALYACRRRPVPGDALYVRVEPRETRIAVHASAIAYKRLQYESDSQANFRRVTSGSAVSETCPTGKASCLAVQSKWLRRCAIPKEDAYRGQTSVIRHSV